LMGGSRGSAEVTEKPALQGTDLSRIGHQKRPVRFLPPSEALTGPASPVRLVCAPGAMTVSFYRRPAQRRRLMWWSQLCKRWLRRSAIRRVRPAPREPRVRLRLEQLESRDVPSAFNLTPLVTVSGTSPFLGNPVEANDPPLTFNLEFEPHLAVDPADSNHLVGAWA